MTATSEGSASPVGYSLTVRAVLAVMTATPSTTRSRSRSSSASPAVRAGGRTYYSITEKGLAALGLI